MAVDKTYEYEIELSRNWHWIWSKFYFNKKHHGFLFAFLNGTPTFCSSLLKFLFLFVTLKVCVLLNYYLYQHTSSKNWVTFVHGAGGSSSIWYKQIRDFKKHFNVLILDLRGHGKSKLKLKDSFNPKYTFDTITNDIVEVIDHLQIKKSHFIGISLGTILIRNLAEKNPALVQSMILGGAIIK